MMMEENGKISHQYDLLDELENGEFISQDMLDSLRIENEELFGILQKSNWLRTAKKVEPDPFYARVSQIRIYYRLVKDRGAKIHPFEQIKYFFSNLVYLTPPSFSLKPVLTVLLALIFSFSVFVGGASAADAARPGQFLYPVDLAIENVQLRLTLKEESRLRLQLEIAEERLAEAQAEFKEGDYSNAAIALAGYEKTQRSIYTQLETEPQTFTQEIQKSAIQSHQQNSQVLTSILESAPQASQNVVLHAIEVSREFTKLQPVLQVPLDTPADPLVDGISPSVDGAEEVIPTLEETGVITAEPVQENTPTQTLLPQTTLIVEEPVLATVWAYSVNVHSGPGLDYRVIAWLLQDQTIQTTTCENGFVFIPEFNGWAKGTCFDPNPCGPPGSCLQILN